MICEGAHQVNDDDGRPRRIKVRPHLAIERENYRVFVFVGNTARIRGCVEVMRENGFGCFYISEGALTKFEGANADEYDKGVRHLRALFEVEAHRKKHMANDEPSDEGESENDEVEAHMMRRASARME